MADGERVLQNRAKVAVVDYGMGNLRSVLNAFTSLGCSVQVARRPDELDEAERIVLPGVGAFGDGIRNLQSAGWVETLEEEVRRKGKPFLGICLGMQLLATTGTEHGLRSGLNWVKGTVVGLQSNDPCLRIPHMGWNDVRFLMKGGLYADLQDSQAFYFVHSYVLVPDSGNVASGICDYGGDFVASIEMDNIHATQFHPEKSHKVGIAVLRNFLNV